MRQFSERACNDAKTGAKMVDLANQFSVVKTRAVDYLTVQMGANDVCTSSESTMTPVSTFRAQFQSAMGQPRSVIANDTGVCDQYSQHLPIMGSAERQFLRALHLGAVWYLQIDAGKRELNQAGRHRPPRPRKTAQHRLQHPAGAGMRDIPDMSLRQQCGVQHSLQRLRCFHTRLFPSLTCRPGQTSNGKLERFWPGTITLRRFSAVDTAEYQCYTQLNRFTA